jgi:hypothetical protein
MLVPDFIALDLSRAVQVQRCNLAEMAACLRDGASPATVAATLLLIADQLGGDCWDAESLIAFGAGEPPPPLPADAVTIVVDAICEQ